ncbi:hypothetical protein [Massilioclostridium coli]|uniref:hypothetical protein n=1 Tax=Massilioclostridium coli TaxID=1870991 RepID=UPI0022E1D914|nr:hypothetical protein [Massilioclostridium coli]
MNILVLASTVNNETATLSRLVEFEYSACIYTVGSKFKGLFIDKNQAHEFTSIKVYLENELLFHGFVDKQVTQLTAVGEFLEIEASGYETRLLQNQVRPTVLENCSSEYIYQNYALPYGIKANGLLSYTLPKLEITVGMSAWNVIDIFCRRAYYYFPLVTKDGTLTARWLNQKMYIIGNKPDSEHYYTSFRYTNDRSQLLSRIYWQNPDNPQDYSNYFDAPYATDYKIQRERYYRLPAAWKTQPDDAVKQVALNSRVKSMEVEVILPELLAAYPGDNIQIEDDYFNARSYYVGEVIMTSNENGNQTLLRLWNTLRL